MLNIFRKYQKVIFIFVSVVVGLSMLFFGNFNKERGGEKPIVDETVVLKTHSGRQVTRDQIEKMARFLTEKHLIEERSGGLPLRINDGVLEKDFLQSGWASLISQKFQTLITSDLKGKIESEKNYKLYRHPSMPMISVDHIWSQSLPELSSAYSDFKTHLSFPPASKDAFDSRVNLYTLNQSLPSSLMKRVLLYQQNIFSGDTPDPILYNTDLSLFTYHTAEDWFGKNFIHIVAQTIYHLSDLASTSGIVVTEKEAEIDLVMRAKNNFANAKEVGAKNLTEGNFSQHFAYSLQRQGLSEKEAVLLWKEVLTYRKLMKGLGSGVLVDELSLDFFNEFANKSCDVRVVDLPSYLHFTSDREHQEFAAYLYAVTKEPSFNIESNFSNSMKNVSDVEKNDPTLVQKRLKVGIKKVNLEDMANDVTIKDMLEWQFDKQNWESLEKQYPSLAKAEVTTSEERINMIRSLSLQEQGDIDQYSRRQIALSRLGNLDKALESALYQEEEWIVLSDGQVVAGPLTSDSTLYASLETVALNSPFEWRDSDLKTFFSIEVNAREEATLLTFKELKDYKLLDSFLTKFAQSHYEVVKANAEETLKDKEGKLREANRSLKPILVYLLKKNPKSYAKEKLNYWLASSQKELMESGELPVSKAVNSETFSPRTEAHAQWALEDSVQTLDRSVGHAYLDFGALFATEEGAYSKVLTSSNGNTYFYQLMKFHDAGNFQRGFELQQSLAHELGREVFGKELDLIAEKETISTSYLDVDSGS